MTQTQLKKETYLERGYTIFKDAKDFGNDVIVGSYRIFKEIMPANLIKPKCALIFGMQCARTKLTKEQEQVVQYYYYMNLPYAEISRRTGLSIYKVQKLQRDALIRLYKYNRIFFA